MKRPPIFVWAPSTRCGSTLLQRLITSGGKTLCFGELNLFTTQIPVTILDIERNEEKFLDLTRRLASGEQVWGVDAIPDTRVLLALLRQTFTVFAAAFQRSAEELGFEGWGVKAPTSHCVAIAQLVRRLLPTSRHIFIVRRIVPIARSQLAGGWTISDLSVDLWAQSCREIASIEPHEDVLIMSYERLVDVIDRELGRLSEFIGAEVDHGVMESRLNGYVGAEMNPEGYVEPRELTAEEEELISTAGAEGLKACEDIEGR